MRITTQPQSRKTFLGATVAFNVAAEAQGPFAYQWRLNQAAIPGATDSLLALTNVQLNQAGLYSVSVSNNLGGAVSSNAGLSVSQIAAWGNNGDGQTNVPANIVDPVKIAAGESHSLALQGDRSVLAWGANPHGECNVPGTVSNVLQIAAGSYHNLALRADGAVVSWGAGTNVASFPHFGQSQVPANVSNVFVVSAGGFHSVALKADGSVIAWGAGTSGWGTPNFGQSIIPSGLTNAVAIAAGRYHTLALRSDGRVLAWGAGTNNIKFPFVGQSMVPVGLSNVVAIAAGGFHSLALKDDGRVVAWGDYYYGQNKVPAGLSNVVAIAAGLNHSAALTEAGVLFLWGDGVSGGYRQSIPPPGLANVEAVAGGGQHTLALVNNGAPYIVGQSHDRSATTGGNATLFVKAIGQQILQYQWQLNATNLDGATNASLDITNIPLSSAGRYQCIVSNALGVAQSLPIAFVLSRSTPRFDAAATVTGLTTSGFGLHLSGLSGHGEIILYGSANLVDWRALLTNPPVLGSLQWTDSAATNLPHQFYRAEER